MLTVCFVFALPWVSVVFLTGNGKEADLIRNPSKSLILFFPLLPNIVFFFFFFLVV